MYLWWDELMGSLGSTQENLCHLWKDNSLFKMSLRQSSNYFHLLGCELFLPL